MPVISDPIDAHLAILKIRRSAGRRDVNVTGTLFFLAIVLTIAMGLLSELRGRALYLIVAVDIGIGTGFVMNWVRWEITKQAIELLDTICREIDETQE